MAPPPVMTEKDEGPCSRESLKERKQGLDYTYTDKTRCSACFKKHLIINRHVKVHNEGMQVQVLHR